MNKLNKKIILSTFALFIVSLSSGCDSKKAKIKDFWDNSISLLKK